MQNSKIAAIAGFVPMSNIAAKLFSAMAVPIAQSGLAKSISDVGRDSGKSYAVQKLFGRGHDHDFHVLL